MVSGQLVLVPRRDCSIEVFNLDVVLVPDRDLGPLGRSTVAALLWTRRTGEGLLFVVGSFGAGFSDQRSTVLIH